MLAVEPLRRREKSSFDVVSETLKNNGWYFESKFENGMDRRARFAVEEMMVSVLFQYKKESPNHGLIWDAIAVNVNKIEAAVFNYEVYKIDGVL